MKRFIILILLIVCSGCTIHFKGKELEMDAEPVLSSNHTYDLEKIEFFKHRH
ncbi:hypothetical protein ES703_65223 [subsurface metagenome]